MIAQAISLSKILVYFNNIPQYYCINECSPKNIFYLGHIV